MSCVRYRRQRRAAMFSVGGSRISVGRTGGWRRRSWISGYWLVILGRGWPRQSCFRLGRGQNSGWLLRNRLSPIPELFLDREYKILLGMRRKYRCMLIPIDVYHLVQQSWQSKGRFDSVLVERKSTECRFFLREPPSWLDLYDECKFRREGRTVIGYAQRLLTVRKDFLKWTYKPKVVES